MTELKPCPFCGDKARVYEDYRFEKAPHDTPKWFIQCTECTVKTPTAKLEQVVSMWNRRVDDCN